MMDRQTGRQANGRTGKDMSIKADEISKIIREQIGSFAVAVDVAEVGTVVSLGDGIARVHGVASRYTTMPCPMRSRAL